MSILDTIIVDDTDSTIQYSDGWISDLQNSILPGVGFIGDPMYGTLHGAASSSGFSYKFNGSFRGAIVVYGTYTQTPASWTCTVDGTNMSSYGWNDQSPKANRQTACFTDSANLAAGVHELQVSVNGTKDGPTWFDFINFNPSSSVPAATTFGDIQVDWTSDQINYGDGWWGDLDKQEIGIVGFKYGATMDLEFIGHSITWIGYANASAFDDSISGTYSVDREPPINFTYRKPSLNLVNGGGTIDNQVIFQTRRYSDGQHHLQVVNQGRSTPLSLLNVIIQNTTANFSPTPVPSIQPLNTPTSSGLSSSTPNSDPDNRQARGHSLGAIIGGCAGALGIIICLICLVLFRRARRRNHPHSGLENLQQYTYEGAHDEKGVEEPANLQTQAPTHASTPQAITLPDPSLNQPTSHQQLRETIVLHQDSGIRYPQTFEPEITESPPQYTATPKVP